jgi:diacylglycerol kinase (ATP)
MNDKTPVQPKRQGLSRVWHAFFYSVEGLRAGWHEPAFRQEAILALMILPGAWWLGQSWAEVVLLVGVVVAVMVVELLNTAVESFYRILLCCLSFQ